MIIELPRVRGRATGARDGPPGRPKFTGTIDEEGRIRIDCENYPEHWQEIQLPEEWVLAYHDLAAMRSNAPFSISAPVDAGYVQTSKFELSAALLLSKACIKCDL